MGYKIAIDGPAGAGKSTIAKRIADQLGFIYVDTGAMYRAMALYLLELGIDAADTRKIEAACQSADISIQHHDGVQQVILNGVNVTGRLREEAVGNIASASSVNPRVRAKLVELQRVLAEQVDVVMDGRDIGTQVLPDAQIKIYLTADARIRAERRFRELQDKGIDADINEIEKDISARDYRDTTRAISPLKQADDAVLVDSSAMTIAQVTETVIKLYRENERKI